MSWSTISYGAAVWGDRTFSCINSIQNKAIRFYMGVGRYTPNVAVNGDSAWKPPCVRQWRTVINHWNRLRYMNTDRLNKRIHNWAEHSFRRYKACKNSNYRLYQQFESCNISDWYNDTNIHKTTVLAKIEDKLLTDFRNKWTEDLHRVSARRMDGGSNKLRTYRTFKTEISCELYLKTLLSPAQRRAYSQFRCGVAPIRIETGRFERLPMHERTCFMCENKTETEEHVLIECPLYDDLRNELYEYINSVDENFNMLTNREKLSFVLGCQNVNVIYKCAKTCKFILDRRRRFLYR